MANSLEPAVTLIAPPAAIEVANVAVVLSVVVSILGPMYASTWPSSVTSEPPRQLRWPE
jgi:hypothetical protein